MRFIFWENHKVLIRNFIFLILGIYLGMFLYLYFHGNQIDQLMYKHNQLSLELNDCKANNEILEKEKKQRTQPLIRTIKFIFSEKLEPFDETELLSTLVKETHFIIGKKVSDVANSPEFIYRLLDGKVFKAKDKQFEVRVKVIYIQTTIEISISTKELLPK